MAKIPIYLSQGTAPAPRLGGLVLATAQERAIGELGGTLVEIGEKFRKAKQATDLANATTQAAVALNDLQTDHLARDNINPESFLAEAKSIGFEMGQDMEDAETRRLFDARFASAVAGSHITVRQGARRQIVERGVGDMENNLLIYRKLVASGLTLEEKQRRTQEALEIIDGQVEAGHLNPKQGEARKRKFMGQIQSDRIKTELLEDPESTARLLADPKVTMFIPEGERLQLLDRAQRQIQILQRRAIAQEEKEAREAERRRKRLVEEMSMDTWAMELNDQLTDDVLERRRELRLIDGPTYRMIKLRRIEAEEDREDDPETVGDLAYRIGLGDDVRGEMSTALKNGLMKPGTFITKMGLLGTKHYDRANRYVTSAMQPGPFDRFRADRMIKMSESLQELDRRIKDGENALNAAATIVHAYTSDVRRTLTNLRRPKHLKGGRDARKSIDALTAALLLTADEYDTGKASKSDYLSEVSLINEYLYNIRQLDRTDSAASTDPDIAERVKKIREEMEGK